jgi:hypothetical protein
LAGNFPRELPGQNCKREISTLLLGLVAASLL